MIAIHTKYIPATNTRGSRIKAYTSSGWSVTVPYNHALSDYHVHYEAVKALVEKHELDWPIDQMAYGDSADGKGFTFCFLSSKVQP